MFKMILAFLVLFLIFFFGIKAVRKMSGKEALVLTTNVFYGIICTVITIVTLAFIVLIF